MMKRTLFSLFLFLGFVVARGQDLPNVKLKDLDGNVVETASFLQSKRPIIISFFGTWCKPCLRELDAIHEVYPDWQKETGVTLYAICINEGIDAQKTKPVVNAHGWEYVVLNDSNADLKRAMAVSAVPALFVLDGEGKIIHRRTGYVEGSESEIIAVLRKSLRASEKK